MQYEGWNCCKKILLVPIHNINIPQNPIPIIEARILGLQSGTSLRTSVQASLATFLLAHGKLWERRLHLVGGGPYLSSILGN